MSEEDLVNDLFNALDKSNTARDIREAFSTLYKAREEGVANIAEVVAQALEKILANACSFLAASLSFSNEARASLT